MFDNLRLVPLILKPLLEKEANGLFSAALYVDSTEGSPLGITAVSKHDSEPQAREALQAALLQHLLGKDAVISVDGVDYGQELARAMAALVLEAGSARLPKSETAEPVDDATRSFRKAQR
jgi:hypothetical protein